MMNNVVLIGRIVSDLELRKIQQDMSVCNFTLAVNRSFSRDDKTDFIDCVAWNKRAELMTQYVGKGSLIAISGSIQVDNYETNEGEKRRATRIVCNSVEFLEPRKNNNQPSDEVKEELVNLDEDLAKTTHDISDDDLPW